MDLTKIGLLKLITFVLKKIALTVLVSLHTLNRDEFINITSVDYFEKVVNNILYWKSLNIKLAICHVIFDKSILKTETFLNWSTKVGIKTILVPNVYDTNINLNIFKEKYDILI